MSLDKIRRGALLSWLSLAVLILLVCVLGALQYRWIGEVSTAERKELRDGLQSSLNEVASDFNSELSRSSAALLPTGSEVRDLGRNRAYQRRYLAWKESAGHPKLFRSVSIAWPEQDGLTIHPLDLASGGVLPEDSPDRSAELRERIQNRFQPGGPGRRGGPPPSSTSTLIDLPRISDFDGRGEPGPPPRRMPDQEWLLLDVDPAIATGTLLPELLARHLGPDYQTQYETSVVNRADRRADESKDGEASASIFEVAPRGPGSRGPGGPGPGFGPPGLPGRGRWLLTVRPHEGSLEAVVASARHRNLGVSAAVLLLLIASGYALLRLSRNAQRLADAEMEFVAGVSHELRTPLTVIRTAAYNLRGKMANHPDQVERYGALIERESEKLTAIVEQVLRFGGARSGHAIQKLEPVSIENVIESTLQSSRGLLEEAGCHVETRIEPDLPRILADSTALQQALQNLIHNAAKYGLNADRWIGIFARNAGSAVEVRIEDRGPGIPADEQKHIFDAFFRGRKATRDQIRGTGLGLSLVKKIVEAHGGTVDVESASDMGTSFVLRIPQRPAEHQDEFAHSLG